MFLIKTKFFETSRRGKLFKQARKLLGDTVEDMETEIEQKDYKEEFSEKDKITRF